MTAAGELVPTQALPAGLAGEPRRGRHAGVSVFDDLVSRLRPYLLPPPPDALGWRAASGAAMTIGAALLLAVLPSGRAIARSDFLHWTGSGEMASAVDALLKLPLPLLLYAGLVLIATGLIYLRQVGTRPALAFLTGQAWIGVIALSFAGLVWASLIALVLINAILWILASLLVVFAVLLALRALAAA